MKKTAEEVLVGMIGLFIEYLCELQDATAGAPDCQFAYGEKTAYVECLEMIGKWECAAQFGLDFDVEERFAL